ncbi:MAG: hypothetical protein R2739_10725 [Chitinophagales bacterium]|nr:hypothetical protein [Bacteroidota bacterium]
MFILSINRFDDFSAKALCDFINDKLYPEIFSVLESIDMHIFELMMEKNSQLNDIVNCNFQIVSKEIKMLFSKYEVLMFPRLISMDNSTISLTPIIDNHKRVYKIFKKIRHLLDDYEIQATWSLKQKKCINELYVLEQSVLYVLYLKENFLLAEIKNTSRNEIAR